MHTPASNALAEVRARPRPRLAETPAHHRPAALPSCAVDERAAVPITARAATREPARAAPPAGRAARVLAPPRCQPAMEQLSGYLIARITVGR